MKMLPVNTNRTPCKVVLSAKELLVFGCRLVNRFYIRLVVGNCNLVSGFMVNLEAVSFRCKGHLQFCEKGWQNIQRDTISNWTRNEMQRCCPSDNFVIIASKVICEPDKNSVRGRLDLRQTL